MTATLYNTAIETLLRVLELMAKNEPATGEMHLQQALEKVEVEIDRAETQMPAQSCQHLHALRHQLLTAANILRHADTAKY